MSTSASTEKDLPGFREALNYIYKFEPALCSEQAANEWNPPPLEEGHNGRYLWTDAFAVIDFLTLHGLTGQPYYLTFAHRLIEAVHDVLGKTRDGAWRLSGATDDNPLGGGLRIGKLEDPGPDGDGQYHHYLTLWLFALNRYSVAAADPHYNSLAIQCAKAVHPVFVEGCGTARPSVYWKMTVDLMFPLVKSQGMLDPFSGYVVFDILDQHKVPGEEGLESEIEDYRKIVDTTWAAYDSSDPLDLGMILWTVHWKPDEAWARYMKGQATESLKQLEPNDELDINLGRRHAFREFGSVMGVKCHDEFADQKDWRYCLDSVLSAWRKAGLVPIPKKEYRDGRVPVKGEVLGKLGLMPITEVMYCAGLIPGAFRKDWMEDHMTRQMR